MKEIFQIFDESLMTIQKLINDKNYAGSSGISTDLITISVMSDFRDGIIIGEVFEGVFDQINQLFQGFKIDAESHTSIAKQIADQVTSVHKSYRDENKEGLYDALRDLRSIATQFQFKCFRTMKAKHEMETERIRFRRSF
jgi:hypothetical protein